MSMERPSGHLDLETSLGEAAEVSGGRLRCREEGRKKKFTFGSRSRCPGPSRTCPTVQLPANNRPVMASTAGKKKIVSTISCGKQPPPPRQTEPV